MNVKMIYFSSRQVMWSDIHVHCLDFNIPRAGASVISNFFYLDYWFLNFSLQQKEHAYKWFIQNE